MIKKIIMPSGGQTTDEMIIQKWNKKVGDQIRMGDILFEIETDKASLPVESFADGILISVLYEEGDKVKTGEVVAYIGEKGDVVPEEGVKAAVVAEVPVMKKNKVEESLPVTGNKQNSDKIIASPLAKSMAKVENIRLEEIASYYSKTLLKKADIDNYLKERQTSVSDDDSYLLSLSTMRKTIARRMKESVLTSPHYTVSIDIDMTELVKLRSSLNAIKGDGPKISYNDILMKIVARAVDTYPLVNSSFRDDKIMIFKNVNIGLAVSLESGLIVPVVKQVNKKSIAEIAAINSRNVEATRNNRLLEGDITGGTITLSNLGMFGINNFTAVINQPESCILAVGAIIAKPVAMNHQVVIREMMNITGSFDHRVIDGAVGAAFLAKIKEITEDPRLLFLSTERFLSEI